MTSKLPSIIVFFITIELAPHFSGNLFDSGSLGRAVIVEPNFVEVFLFLNMGEGVGAVGLMFMSARRLQGFFCRPAIATQRV